MPPPQTAVLGEEYRSHEGVLGAPHVHDFVVVRNQAVIAFVLLKSLDGAQR